MKTLAAFLCCALFAFAARAGDPVSLDDFRLVGAIHGDRADFTLTARARVTDSHGGEIVLLSGPVALTALDVPSRENLRADAGRFVLSFNRRGEFPVEARFTAAVTQTDGWRTVSFHVAPGVVEPVTLQGLAADTEIKLAGAAQPQRQGADFAGYLPSDGAVQFSWKEVRPETEGALFFSTEMLSQIAVRPGLMRQTAVFNFKVMQGEMNRVTLLLDGAGDVTRVQGEQALSWQVESGMSNAPRRLVVQLNQPQSDQFSLQVQTETPLDAFPQVFSACRLRPENATRFAGYVRVANDGAVRLDVTPSGGLSQISPDQFPESEATRAAFGAEGNQRFAYRFAGDDFGLRIAADEISPEFTVSHLLTYSLGENELAIDDNLELDIHEAPLRELSLRIPKGYVVARLNAAGMSDYFVTEPPGQEEAELRIVYGQPAPARQLVDLRLERNRGLEATNWNLPRVTVEKAKSARGNVGVVAEAGFRLATARVEALTEIAPAYFPAKPAGLQNAFRIDDAGWVASMRVERMPETVQVEAFHLFSIGEGVAYGSSVLNYAISGAPAAALRIELADDCDNVEFVGKNIRSWRKTDGGYLVQLQAPVAGAYTMLATYERPFKAQGDTVAFTGARPLDAQSEQGCTVVVSAWQFQVKPTEVSPGLLPLEPAEVPAEDRLFFDAPILAAYRYAARPFNLRLALSPLAQGESVSQLVDRAALQTRISKEGQVVTTARYFIKNRGHPALPIELPPGASLWTVTVNQKDATPVVDGARRLIPLPPSADPNAVLELDLTLAQRSDDAGRVTISAPIVDAPVMLGEWKLAPDAGRRLAFEGGSLRPEAAAADNSGFAQVIAVLAGPNAWRAWLSLAACLALGAASIVTRRTVLSAIAAVLVIGVFIQLGARAKDQIRLESPDLTFLAPVQQAGSALTVTVTNGPDEISFARREAAAWPALLALPLGLAAWLMRSRLCLALAWMSLAGGALLAPRGGGAFFWIVGAAVLAQTARPVFDFARRGLGRASGGNASAPATAAIAAGFILLTHQARAAAAGYAMPDSVSQTIRVEKNFAFGEAKLHWRVTKGEILPLLAEPAILTGADLPERAFRLEDGAAGSKRARQLVALRSGAFDIELRYEAPLGCGPDGSPGLTLPTPFGLVNNLTLTVAGADVEAFSPQAVAVQSQYAGTNSTATIILTPAETWISWRPRRRDVHNEKPVFYAELDQLFAPTAGVVEGAHWTTIRPAQGELSEVDWTIPAGATITDVTDAPGQAAPQVSLWRFDPETHKLRVTLRAAQSRPFALVVHSQAACGSLPFSTRVGLISMDNAAGQIGLVGVATGGEVQLDSASGASLSAINLEDFPAAALAPLQSQIPGLTLRRAYRYADAAAQVSLQASAVKPDVRVETQDTLSLGEDRALLAASLKVDIARAGVFDLSFVLPAGFEVDAISGPALSQWTEAKTETGRVVTLHLTGKTLGQQTFAASLVGPGVKTARGWKVPRLILREAGKQRGSLLIVPEQGMRLQVARRDGYTQLDPAASGIHENGALAFEQLQTPADLALDIEQVDPWIEATVLQHAAATEAQLKVIANFQYEIENTGLKQFRVRLPADAQGVRFDNDQLADFQADTAPATNGWQTWSVKLRRRVMGASFLQAAYEIPLGERATNALLRGAQAADANLQRGFLTIQSDPRLQISAPPATAALQPAEWQSIPRHLQKDLQSAAADFTWRVVDSGFQLPLKFERHEAAKALPAHVNNIALRTVVSDDGVALTQAVLQIDSGDKRLLAFRLPADARFWFAFVNDTGVWPWREGEDILIPLERRSDGQGASTVEIDYSCRGGEARDGALDLSLLAPKFELPLENITWRVALGEKWHVKHWQGSFQFVGQETGAAPASVDPQLYLASETAEQQQRAKEAQAFVALGNNSLQAGDPQQARRAFEAAYGLSTHDPAFNEDARVQLHNVKIQEALVGLNLANSAAAGDAGALGGRLRDLRGRASLNYSQQDAKDILDSNSADDNAAYLRLADKLVQQQDAAIPAPAMIRANLPQEGRTLIFKRAVAVDTWADLAIGVKASLPATASWGARLLVIGITLAVFLFFGAGAFRPRAA